MRKYLQITSALIVLTFALPLTSLAQRKNKTANLLPITETSAGENKNNRSNLSGCTDKNNYVGNTAAYNFQLGGKTAYDPFLKFFQTFPDYIGSVTSVEFSAAKYTSAAANYTCFVSIYDLGLGNVPQNQIGSSVAVVITTTANTIYSVSFPVPISVPANFNGDGFAVCITYNAANQDSVKIYSSPQLTTNVATSYCNYAGIGNSINDVASEVGINVNFLFKPTYTIQFSPLLSASATSSPCSVPATFLFTGTPFAPSWLNSQYINPNGYTQSLNFGDASPNVTNPNVSHTYNIAGNYLATYTQTMLGWTTNCPQTDTYSVIVSSSVTSAFSFNTNGLNVAFTNNSSNGTSFLWNFGDLTTSTLQNPGNHLYSSPGTYLVELDVTGPCGGPAHYQQNVVVTNTISGIYENEGLANQISIYPNPTSNILTLHNSNIKEVYSSVYIFSSLGNLVKKVTSLNTDTDNLQINVSDLPVGVYFLQVNTKSASAVKLFIKD